MPATWDLTRELSTFSKVRIVYFRMNSVCFTRRSERSLLRRKHAELWSDSEFQKSTAQNWLKKFSKTRTEFRLVSSTERERRTSWKLPEARREMVYSFPSCLVLQIICVWFLILKISIRSSYINLVEFCKGTNERRIQKEHWSRKVWRRFCADWASSARKPSAAASYELKFPFLSHIRSPDHWCLFWESAYEF